jgi:hypothetical protein
MTPASRAFLANAFLAPVVGTMVAHRRASAVLIRDIAGVPIIAYAFIATLIPVVVLTGFGNRICRVLLSGGRSYSVWGWCLAGAGAGAAAGVLVGLAWRLVAQASDSNLVVAGLAAGAACGVVQAVLWLRQARSGPDVAVA